MPLPAMTNGCLPPDGSPYLASLEEIRDRFVVEAPAGQERDQVFRAVHLAVEGMAYAFGPGQILLGGEFVTHRSGRLPVARMVLVPTDWKSAWIHLSTDPRTLPWLTLEGSPYGSRLPS